MTVLQEHKEEWSTSSHVTQFKRASPDFPSDEDLFDPKRQKADSDLLILYEEELLLTSDHIVPVAELLQPAAECLDGLSDSTWITSLLDADRSLLATLQFSFVDDGFSLEGGFLPQEIQVRETASFCLWQPLRMDPSTPVVLAKFIETNCNGASFRSQLWQTRKSAIIDLPNGWEMHLVAEVEDPDHPITGYLCPSRLPQLLAQQEMDGLLERKMMAAAVDIDDTLVKAIPEAEARKYPTHRVHALSNLPIVVAVSSDAELFLRQAATKFKLSLYSVGTPEYVREIGCLLDPGRTIFDWNAIESGSSSARHEHDHAGETAPKRLERLFAFCNTDDGVDYRLCLAVDDNPRAWAPSCRSKVVQVNSGFDDDGLWDSDLAEVWMHMERLHGEASRDLPCDDAASLTEDEACALHTDAESCASLVDDEACPPLTDDEACAPLADDEACASLILDEACAPLILDACAALILDETSAPLTDDEPSSPCADEPRTPPTDDESRAPHTDDESGMPRMGDEE